MSGNIRTISKHDGLDLYSHSESVRDTAFIINAKGGFNLDCKVLYWSSILHDIGKMNPLFLENMKNNDFTNIMRHEIASLCFIEVVPEDVRDIVAFVILSHHKSINNDERSILRLYNEDEDILFNNHIGDIKVWGDKVKYYFLYHYGIDINIPSFDECKLIFETYVDKINNLEKGYSLYRGIFMMADHFASCYSNNEERVDNLDSLFNSLNLSYYHSEDSRYPLSLIKKDKCKKHTLCIAPTGCGKTNFMMKMCEGKRIFYTLPYQASINAMQQRLTNDVGDNGIIGIKHSSLMSIPFVDSRTKTLSTFYGLPVKVITPFQIIEAIIRNKGYESTILDLTGQAVIFDELHTYNSMSMTYIIEMIKFLIGINCSIHICTATMPSHLQKQIVDILNEDGGVQLVKLNEKDLLTYNRHIIHTLDVWEYQNIIKRYNNNEKVLVVRNTVKDAMDTYNTIKSMCNCKIMLIHSRWKRSDRSLLEKKLIENFNSVDEPCIVVSTQVVEVSLDINFDVLFTDCADIMSLIQRFGRINRQRKNIGVLKDVFIINVEITEKIKKGLYPYSEEVLNKTFSEFQKINNGILDETYIQVLIDNVHSTPTQGLFSNATPWNENGEWKNTMYSHVLNTSVAKQLNFNGYVCVLDRDKDEYLKTYNSDLEIPLSYEPKKYQALYDNKNEKIIAYIVPNKNYDSELGLIL